MRKNLLGLMVLSCLIFGLTSILLGDARRQGLERPTNRSAPPSTTLPVDDDEDGDGDGDCLAVLSEILDETVTRQGSAFVARLTGAQEVPAPGVVSNATGDARAVFDRGLTQLQVALDVRERVCTSGGPCESDDDCPAGAFCEDLGTPDVVGAHFHCGKAGQNGPIALGLISPGPCALVDGELDCTLTNADFTGADCVPVIGCPVNNIASLKAAMDNGLIYINVHTPSHPGGEIRGQPGSSRGTEINCNTPAACDFLAMACPDNCGLSSNPDGTVTCSCP